MLLTCTVFSVALLEGGARRMRSSRRHAATASRTNTRAAKEIRRRIILQDCRSPSLWNSELLAVANEAEAKERGNRQEFAGFRRRGRLGTVAAHRGAQRP